MRKYRLVERTLPDGRVLYVAQQRHMLFKWKWIDARESLRFIGRLCNDRSFERLEAEAMLSVIARPAGRDKVVLC